jgi:hypothetical protein
MACRRMPVIVGGTGNKTTLFIRQVDPETFTKPKAADVFVPFRETDTRIVKRIR